MAGEDQNTPDVQRRAREQTEALVRQRAAMDQDGERAKLLGRYFAQFYLGVIAGGAPESAATIITSSYVGAFMQQAQNQNPRQPGEL